MRIAVCGHGRAGKDTVCQWLAQNTSLRYEKSTSQAAAEVVFRRMAELGHGYPSVQACWEDRHNHRELWAETIWAYNQPDGLTLYRQMAETNDVLNGIRRWSELEACANEGIVDYSIWVSAPVAVDPSNEIGLGHCSYVISNCGSPGDLQRQLWDFVIGLRDRPYGIDLVKETSLRS